MLRKYAELRKNGLNAGVSEIICAMAAMGII